MQKVSKEKINITSIRYSSDEEKEEHTKSDLEPPKKKARLDLSKENNKNSQDDFDDVGVVTELIYHVEITPSST